MNYHDINFVVTSIGAGRLFLYSIKLEAVRRGVFVPDAKNVDQDRHPTPLLLSRKNDSCNKQLELYR